MFILDFIPTWQTSRSVYPSPHSQAFEYNKMEKLILSIILSVCFIYDMWLFYLHSLSMNIMKLSLSLYPVQWIMSLSDQIMPLVKVPLGASIWSQTCRDIGGALGLLALPAGSVGFAVLPSSAHLVETKETINVSTQTFDLKVIKSLFYVVKRQHTRIIMNIFST